MSTTVSSLAELPDLLPEKMQCPLCLGEGEISRAEVLERLGMKDFARVAQLSAEEAMRLLLKQEKQSEQARWAKFEVELTNRLAEVTQRHQAELQKLQTEKNEVEAAAETAQDPEYSDRTAGGSPEAGRAAKDNRGQSG